MRHFPSFRARSSAIRRVRGICPRPKYFSFTLAECLIGPALYSETLHVCTGTGVLFRSTLRYGAVSCACIVSAFSHKLVGRGRGGGGGLHTAGRYMGRFLLSSIIIVQAIYFY